MQRVLYSWLLRLALPAQALRYTWRGWRSPAYRGSLRAHLAMKLAPRADHPLWLHAASVGEVQALLPLVRRLRVESPDVPLLITVGTAPGLARARQAMADLLDARIGTSAAVTLLPAPWDLPGAARRFVAAQQPRAGVFIETELWPNLLHHASQAGIPLLLSSARVSERSTRRYRRFAPDLMRATVRAFTRIGAQTPADRERFVLLGADPDAVQCWGNLKFDFAPPAQVAGQGRELRARLAPARPMWVAGSTHAPEEEVCLLAQKHLRQHAGQSGAAAALLVIAPRRPERFDEVAQLIEAQGFSLVRHTALVSSSATPAFDVLLVDRLGELLPYYAAADLAFVGGSIAPVGGHNLLEPAALGRPVLAGAHTGNAPEVAAQLEAAGALARVADAGELGAELGRLLEDAALRRRRGEAAAAVGAAQGGATTRTLAAITAVLARPAGRLDARFPQAPSAAD